MLLAQGRNAVTAATLEPAILQSRLKHSFTEKLVIIADIGHCKLVPSTHMQYWAKLKKEGFT